MLTEYTCTRVSIVSERQSSGLRLVRQPTDAVHICKANDLMVVCNPHALSFKAPNV